MTKPRPLVKVDRTHSTIGDNQATLRVKTFWGFLEEGELDDIRGVSVSFLRKIPSTQFLFIYEYDITIQGDASRRRIVQNAIEQTIKKNATGRRILVMLANRMLPE